MSVSETSTKTYRELVRDGVVATQREEILEAIIKFEVSGIEPHYHQIMEVTGHEKPDTSGRINDLRKRDKLIEVRGKARSKQYGKLCQTYGLSPLGQDLLKDKIADAEKLIAQSRQAEMTQPAKKRRNKRRKAA